MSPAVAGFPILYFGDCAIAKPAASTMSAADLYTVHLPISCDPPSLGPVVVIVGIKSRRLSQFLTGRLHIARFVRCPAHDLNFAPIPFPGHPEACEGHRQTRF